MTDLEIKNILCCVAAGVAAAVVIAIALDRIIDTYYDRYYDKQKLKQLDKKYTSDWYKKHKQANVHGQPKFKFFYH